MNEAIEKELKLSKKQDKNDRYNYLCSQFNGIEYAMKLEKYTNKLQQENKKLRTTIKNDDVAVNNLCKEIENLKQQLKDKDEKISKAKQYLEKNFYYCLASGDDITHYIDELCDYLYDNIKDIKIVK